MTSVQTPIDNGNLADHGRRLTALKEAAIATAEKLEGHALRNTRGELVDFDFVANLSRALRKRADGMQRDMKRAEKYQSEGKEGVRRTCLEMAQKEWERFLEIMTTQGLPPKGRTCPSCKLEMGNRVSICQQCETDEILAIQFV